MQRTIVAMVLATLLAGCGYNRMVTMKETIESSWAQVQNQLKRRNDLIPNLVAVTKGYAGHEREIFEKIADARARLLAGGSRSEQIDAATALSGALGRLLAIAEQYPNLKADAQFAKLSDELAGTENRIAVERMRYNDAVRAYNAYVKSFPVVLYAGTLGFTPEKYFEVPEGEQQVPKVDFGRHEAPRAPEPRMRVLVVGTGAVGGYFGALLARGGHDVAFVARGANLVALRAQGLRIELGDDTMHLAAPVAVEHPAEAPPPDLVLVCVKSYDTAAVAATLRPAVRPETIVLSLQNGVENEDVLAAVLGLPPLMLALTQIGVALTGPGVVRFSGRGNILFGEPDGHESARARAVHAALTQAGIPAEIRADIRVAAWEKLAWNAGFNAVTTITRSTVAEVLAVPTTRELVIGAMEEVDAVATALGIPVRRWRTASVVADSVDALPDFQTSMLQDLLRGRRLEYDAITGAVLRAAGRAGVAVPVNRALLALLARVDPAARAGR